jgi:hypothetical protein
MVVGLAIHIILNMVLKEFPTVDPTVAELQAYLSKEAATWAIVHGFRYVAFACLLLFSAGLFARTCCTRAGQTIGWGIVGLLGTAVWVTTGMITNGIETLAFLNLDLVSKQQELFWLLFRLTRVLFTGEVVAWSFVIFGFSVAGWRSATLPRWISTLGFVHVMAGMLSGVFIVSVINEGPATAITEVAALTGMAWFACTGIYMFLRGES